MVESGFGRIDQSWNVVASADPIRIEREWVGPERRAGEGVACSGQVTAVVLGPIGDREARVVAVGEDGAPIEGAAVDLYLGSLSRTAMTDADGAARFSELDGAIDAVTVRKAGYQRVSVLSPGRRDVLLPIDRDRTTAEVAGGIRGSIDLSRVRKADLSLEDQSGDSYMTSAPRAAT